jgi:hypothetical protein
MTSDSTVVSLHQPEAIDDPLTAILRSGARRLLAQAVEAEAEAFLGVVQNRPVLGHTGARRAPACVGPDVDVRCALCGRRPASHRVRPVGAEAVPGPAG